MADSILTDAAEAAARPNEGFDFQTGADLGSTFGKPQEPALLVNPAASAGAILGAAAARAQRLDELLMFAALAGRAPEGRTAAELASALQPLAEEIALLIGAAQSRVRGAA